MTNYFLSSTFHDMQSERDMILRRVLPAIKEHAHTLGLDVSITDLRWGIDTSQMESEEGMSKILSVCMKELDYCYPHIIILLGDRYGSVPSKELIMRFCSEKLENAGTLEQFLGKSVTEMEILYALFNGKAGPANVTVCIREPLDYEKMPKDISARFVSTDPEEAQKLKELKARLVAAFPDRIVRYHAKWSEDEKRITGLDTFCEHLTQRLIAQIQTIRGTAAKTKEERQLNQDRVFAQTQTQFFSGRQAQLAELQSFLQNDTEQIFLLSGPSGSGKSCLLAKFAQEVENAANVITLFCGNGKNLSSTTDLMDHLSWRLCQLMGVDSTPYQETGSVNSWRKKIGQLLSRYSDETPLLLIIDALDALRHDELLKNAGFIPDLSSVGKNVKIIVSAAEGIVIPGLFKISVSMRTSKLEPISEDDIREMINLRMKRSHKEIPQSTAQRLHDICIYKSALYVSLVLSRFDLLSRQDYHNIKLLISKETNDAKAFYDYMEAELAALPQSEGDLAIHLLSKVKYELQYASGDEIVKILCAFPEGIRCEDVWGIMQHMGIETDLLEMKVFLRSVQGLIRRTQDDLLFFRHQLIYRGIASQVAGDADRITRAAYEYFHTVPDLDPVKQTVFLKICCLSNNARGAADYIANTNRLEEQFSAKQADGRLDATKNVMQSLQTVYAKYGADRVFQFVQALLTVAAQSDDTFYHVCSAFLFTLDTFFTETMPSDQKITIMRNLYDSAVHVLYPNKDRNPLYLRVLYVCCEQNGIRATQYEDRDLFYREFNRYCLEFVSSIGKDYEYIIDIVRDLSISYEKLADLYIERNWRLAVALYDKALEVAKCDLHDDRRPYLLRDRINSILGSRAECIIRQARLYQRIGWLDEDDLSMQSYLRTAELDLGGAVHYLANCRHRTNVHHEMARCYSGLADLARLRGESEKELKFTQYMLKYAREAYRSDDSIILLDWVRNAEFRLGCSASLLDEDQRQIHLQNAFSLALKVKQHSPTKMADTIVSHCATALLKAYKRKIQQYSTDRSAGTDIVCSELCRHCLTEMTPVLEQLFSHDKGEENYNSFLMILRHAVQLTDDWHELAVAHWKLGNAQASLEAAQRAYDLLCALKKHLKRKTWLQEMTAACRLLRICCHNSSISALSGRTMNRESSRQLRDQQMNVQSELFSLILCYEAEYGIDEYSNKCKQDYYQHPGSPMCLCYGWLLFAREYLCDPEKESVFWNYLKEINYQVPNWGTVSLDAMSHPGFRESKELQTAIGQYLCDHYGEQRVKILLYASTLFEDLALEYAYQSMNYDTAQKIIENGYDRYLELSALYIIRRHDRHGYFRLVHELKFHCLSKHRKTIRSQQSHRILDSYFLSEADELFQKILLTRRSVAPDDPRLHTPRSVCSLEK